MAGLELIFGQIIFFWNYGKRLLLGFTKLDVENKAKNTLKLKLRIFHFFNGK